MIPCTQTLEGVLELFSWHFFQRCCRCTLTINCHRKVNCVMAWPGTEVEWRQASSDRCGTRVGPGLVRPVWETHPGVVPCCACLLTVGTLAVLPTTASGAPESGGLVVSHISAVWTWPILRSWTRRGERRAGTHQHDGNTRRHAWLVFRCFTVSGVHVFYCQWWSCVLLSVVLMCFSQHSSFALIPRLVWTICPNTYINFTHGWSLCIGANVLGQCIGALLR